MKSPAAPAYKLWPEAPGLDFDALYRAERRATQILREWHALDGADLSSFGGVSFGRLLRSELAPHVMGLFRQAAKGAASRSGELWRYERPEKYEPAPRFSWLKRRGDFKANAFCVLAGLCAPLFPRGGRAPILLVSSPSNRELWRHWLSSKELQRRAAIDFPLQQPPGIEFALKGLVRGGRVFDPPRPPLDAKEKIELEALQKRLHALFRDPRWKSLFDWDGKNFSSDFLEGILEPALERLGALASLVKGFNEELIRLAPRLIILPQDASSEAYLLMTLARRRKIPVWFLNHGFPAGGYSFQDSVLCGDLDADRILSWSRADAENYILAGAAPERVLIAGCPAFDALLPAAPVKPFRGAAGTTVLVAGIANYAAFRGALYDNAEERFFTDVTRILSEQGAARILYKLHPGPPRKDFYLRLRARLRLQNVEILQEESFTGLLHRSDFAVGDLSTAAFETLLCGKDYFMIGYQPNPTPPPFEPSQAFVAKTAAEFERNLREGRAVPREILEEFCGLKGNERPFHTTRKIFTLIQRELGL